MGKNKCKNLGGIMSQFWNSAVMNQITYNHYFNHLSELGMTMFEWHNLPEGIDPRFMEMTLFNEGYAIFFYDEAMDEYLCLQARIGGQMNVYRVPKIRTAYAVNGYQYQLNENNSVIIYNNYLRYPSVPDAQFFAAKLVNIDRAIDVNVNAQKTPILIRTTPDQQLGLENAFMKWQGNQPVIYANKGSDLDKAFDVLTTGAPNVFKDLYELKTQTWNEALTRMGISSVNTVKRNA